MNVETLIRSLQKMAEPEDEVFLIVEVDGSASSGVFTGKVVATGSGAEAGRCEVYGKG